MVRARQEIETAGGIVSRRTRAGRAIKLLPVVALLGAILVPAPPAVAQATRTWVSGVGDDANPCSRTAPCKTFAGAISKTAASGEINVIDPGGFGGVTIGKSITINGCNTEAGVLVSGTNAIVVNAAATDRVTLRCLDINGLGTSLAAVRILSAKTVKITDSEMFGFTRNAIDVQNSNAGLKVTAARNFIHDNTGAALMASPGNGADATVIARNNEMVDNGCGLVAAQFGSDTTFGTNCGARTSASGISGIAIINAFDNLIATSAGSGVLSRGSLGINRLGGNTITGNLVGLSSVDSGPIQSFGGNIVNGNGTNGAPTAPIIPPVAP